MKRKIIPGLLAGGAIAAVSPTGAIVRASGVAVGSEARAAAAVFGRVIGSLSDSTALEVALRSYYSFKATRPDLVRQPLLYFVDYGLPATQPRGWVLDMTALRVVDGPFMVAHGRGSAGDARGVPTRFSNRRGSMASSLGLFLAGETYEFRGTAAGRPYRSIGLRLQGVSGRMNDNAIARHIVAHGAPYVTADGAGRSAGCPAIEPQRAVRLLPRLAGGGMVYLFSPHADLMTNDPWAARSTL